jgi:nickel-dependent lactate racemase
MDALSRMLSFYSHYKIKKVLILPPDITRLNSYAGSIVKMLCDLLPCAVDIMPALGTHMPMTSDEISKMYPGVPEDMFLAHNWRSDVVEIGQIPAQFVAGISEGRMKTPVTVEINRRLLDLNYDLVFSVGQVVPHEVVGMSNFNKNIFVGCGGSSIINSSHYLGALYGMERMMGRDNTPVHKLFDYAEQHFAMNIPIIYIMTVTTSVCDKVRVHSLAIGRDRELFAESIRVSQLHNLTFLEKPLKKVVVYLDPEEFRTTWLGNKAIYRTRMAMADAGELIIVAPGVYRCGEDIINDAVIKKYGYLGRDKILELTNANEALSNNLSVAAHLIHGSSDGRFKITYAPGQMTREEIEEIGFAYMPIKEAMERFDIKALENGFNVVDGEEIFFVNNPAIGLWAEKARFYND